MAEDVDFHCRNSSRLKASGHLCQHPNFSIVKVNLKYIILRHFMLTVQKEIIISSCLLNPSGHNQSRQLHHLIPVGAVQTTERHRTPK